MPTNQPTVLVKKADGTFARMTLEEIKQMRSGTASPTPPLNLPLKEGETAKAAATVRKPVIPTKPLSGQILRSARLDSARLAQDDSLGQRSPDLVGIRDDKQPRVNQVDEVLKKLRFQVPEQLQNRLRSIIQLRLKDIRSVNQTKDKVIQAVAEGGLGLGDKEAGELVSVCGIILDRETKNSNLADVPVLKKKVLLPMVEPDEIPAVATPFNGFVHGESGKTERLAPRRTSGDSPVLSRGNDNVTPPPTSPSERGRQSDKNNSGSVLSTKPTIKMAMEDVQAPRPVEMGPVEEIQYMSLVDFRRLSAKPVEAAARLKQKFLNLRDESVVLYLDALAAWHKSPLYMDYMKNVTRALKEKRKMSALEGGDSGKIKLEEILAIVGMEKELE